MDDLEKRIRQKKAEIRKAKKQLKEDEKEKEKGNDYINEIKNAIIKIFFIICTLTPQFYFLIKQLVNQPPGYKSLKLLQVRG